MKVYNFKQLKDNTYNIIKDVLSFDEPIEIRSNNKSVIIISKEKYNNINETLYLIDNNIHKVVKECEESAEYINYDDKIWQLL